MEGLVTKHEVWTWELLHVLFSHIQDAEPSKEATAADALLEPMVCGPLFVLCASATRKNSDVHVDART